MKSIKKESVIEFEEKKSKFIGYAKPVGSKLEAEEYIRSIKKRHPDATHNCSAYKLFENGQEYFKLDDDGEPSGTAGKPMGEILNYMDINNVVVVATRYFGGIKLGAGGLVRNYAKTAKLAILSGEIGEFKEKKEYVIDFPYDKNGEVDQILKGIGVEPTDKNYSERVTYQVTLDNEALEVLNSIDGVLILN
ncbi:MAG: IMPACT family protein [Fusobacteriaceae bacterium]